jgi:3-oxo-5alpha-steroid 4-dehydrogenase
MDQLNRRDFLRGTVVFGGAAALAGLAACAPRQSGNGDAAQDNASASTDLPESWDKEADVVVVGSGSGGCSSAWFALDGGLSAIVVESEATPGGSSIANAGAFTYAATAVQKEMGFETTAEQVKAWFQYGGLEGVPKELFDLYIYQGAEVIDWLRNDVGVQFGSEWCDSIPYYVLNAEGQPDWEYMKEVGLEVCGNELHPNFLDGWGDATPMPLSHIARLDPAEALELGYITESTGSTAFHGGQAFMLPMIKSVQEKGGQILCNTKAVKAFKDETGKVCGIQCDGEEGTVNIKANRGVVIAGGNWAGDPELMARYGGRMQYSNFSPLTMAEGGTALKIGIGMGGAVVNGDSWWLNSSNALVSTAFCISYLWPISNAIWVDSFGNRFVAEDEYIPGTSLELASKMLCRPNSQGENLWLICDKKTYDEQAAMMDAYQGMMGSFAGADSEGVRQTPYNRMMGSSAEADSEAGVYTASSIKELAETIDAPNLPETIRYYNECLAAGGDIQFGKDPRCCRAIEDGEIYAGRFGDMVMGYSHGGLDINVNGEVLDASGNPIPGLFAAGRSARTICEGFHEPTSNMSCAPAMVMGRIIGQYISSQS